MAAAERRSGDAIADVQPLLVDERLLPDVVSTPARRWPAWAAAALLHASTAAAFLAWPAATPPQVPSMVVEIVPEAMPEAAPPLALAELTPPPPLHSAEVAPPEPSPPPEPEVPDAAEPLDKAPEPLPEPPPKPRVETKPKTQAKPRPALAPKPVAEPKEPAPHHQTAATASLAAPVRADAAPAAPAYVPPSSQAAYLNNPKPVYPHAARRRGMQGTVLLSVQVDAEGRTLGVTLKQSSGYALLDRAAQEAVSTWRFVPASRGGRPVAATVEVPIRFALER